MIFRLTTESLSIEFMVILILTIPTSESSDIDKTNIETPTVTAGPKIWWLLVSIVVILKNLPHIARFLIWHKSWFLDVSF